MLKENLFFFRRYFFASIFFALPFIMIGQVTVKGKVIDKNNKEPLIGANITVKNTDKGVITDVDGTYEISVPSLPATLVVSYIGYNKIEQTVSTGSADFSLEEENILVNEIVVSASRVEERLLESPVTVEKLDPIAIKQSSSADYYDEIANMKGVQVQRGSLTFTAVNTRGFGGIANNRFVQLVDGMDNSAPLLQFPLGNLVGVGEMDINSVELVPGAASALYGPNAYNGILLMTSRNPFTSQGLSVQTKYGINKSDAAGSTPMYQVSARYAKAFGNFAFKINASLLDATDWSANDYTTGRRATPTAVPGQLGAPNFDGMNLYGDETQIAVPMAALAAPLSQALAGPFSQALGIPAAAAQQLLLANIPKLPALDVRRTGFKEEDLLDNQAAKSYKIDGALHYKLSDKIEASYSYRFGSGSSVYQGAERYALRDFISSYQKLELNGSNFWLRAYQGRTKDGDSYNLSALGAFVNERFKPSSAAWVPTYAGTYAGALLPIYLQGGTANAAQLAGAHNAARNAANQGIPAAGTPEFNKVVEAVRTDLFQRNPPGAGFVDASVLSHAEFGYNFKELISPDVLDVLVGGNYRQYDLFSDATVFNEDPERTGTAERIKVDEYGMYVQAGKRLLSEKLKLTASLRYDKAQNFEGQVSPRVSMVYSGGSNREHNFRASFQTGFRNPSNQDQYIFFPAGAGILLGGTKANAERYGIYNGNAYTDASYQQFLASVISGAPNPALLKTINLEYVQPEKLKAYEVGYKGIINKKLYIDLNFYHQIYNDFISGVGVRAINGTTIGGVFRPGVADQLAGRGTATAFRPVTNIKETITSSGLGVGLNYRLAKGYTVYGNFNYQGFTEPANPDFAPGFNSPEYQMVIGLANRKVFKNIGFDINYRYQTEFEWQSTFAFGMVPAYGILGAQVNYDMPSYKTNIKIGGTNIGGKDYRTLAGGPFIGQQYFISLTYDGVSR